MVSGTVVGSDVEYTNILPVKGSDKGVTWYGPCSPVSGVSSITEGSEVECTNILPVRGTPRGVTWYGPCFILESL